MYSSLDHADSLKWYVDWVYFRSIVLPLLICLLDGTIEKNDKELEVPVLDKLDLLNKEMTPWTDLSPLELSMDNEK